uniref:Uncharacterized protein n=1 Tax=Oryza sativa subsp. japonica TaxID=39947 RepID=Q6ZKD5_ORYSJ|nr:hypothetical protein [Oryza sativa Japonica Group]
MLREEGAVVLAQAGGWMEAAAPQAHRGRERRWHGGTSRTSVGRRLWWCCSRLPLLICWLCFLTTTRAKSVYQTCVKIGALRQIFQYDSNLSN